MNLVNVNDYLANVAQIVRKCPTNTLRHAYVRAMREWCQQAQWLRTNVAGVTVADVPQYALGNDPNLDIIGIYALQGTWTPPGGNPQTWSIPPSASSSWNPNIGSNRPAVYQYVPEAQFALYPTPDQVYDLLITVILTPKEGAVNIPQAPLQKYSNDFENGALEYLLAIPGMPWTDPRSADFYGRKFRSAISNGKAEAQRLYNTGAQRAQPRAFAVRNSFGGGWR